MNLTGGVVDVRNVLRPVTPVLDSEILAHDPCPVELVRRVVVWNVTRVVSTSVCYRIQEHFLV